MSAVGRKGTEIRWKEARRQGDWIPGGREHPGRGPGRGAAGASRDGHAPSPVRNRVGRGEGQMTLDLLSPWKDLGFPKESWNGLGGSSAEEHHDVTYIF